MFAGNERLYLNSYVNQHFLLHATPAMTPSPAQEQDEPISLVVRESKPSPRPTRGSPIEGEIATIRPLPFRPGYSHISPVFASRLHLTPLALPPPPDTFHSEKDFGNKFLQLDPPAPPPTATMTNWTYAIKTLVDKHQQTPDSSGVSRESRSVSPLESTASSRNSPSPTHRTSRHQRRQSRHRRKAVSQEEKSTNEYQEKRIRNNIAAKKSRDKRRLEEKMMQLLNAYLKNKLNLLEAITDKCSCCKRKREFEYGKLPEPDYGELLRKFVPM